MRITVQEFRRACDTLVRFIQQHNGLAEEERRLVVTVVRTLAHTRANFATAGPGHSIGRPPLQFAPDRRTRSQRTSGSGDTIMQTFLEITGAILIGLVLIFAWGYSLFPLLLTE